MCSGPKSWWKALYSSESSIEKYTGGVRFRSEFTAEGPSTALADRLEGDLREGAGSGYGKRVSSRGGVVYDAR